MNRLLPALVMALAVFGAPAAALAGYMDASLSIPTATTFRTLTVGVLDAQRRKINADIVKVVTAPALSQSLKAQGFDVIAGTPEQLQRWAGTQSLHLLDEEVVVVCHPRLLGKRKSLKAEALATMPLLQQGTRPDAWSQWFAQAQVEAPRALAGPRYEQFSMTVAAAAQGLGLALVPRLALLRALGTRVCRSIGAWWPVSWRFTPPMRLAWVGSVSCQPVLIQLRPTRHAYRNSEQPLPM